MDNESLAAKIGELSGKQAGLETRIQDLQYTVRGFEKKIDDQKDFFSEKLDAGINRVMQKLEEKVSVKELDRVEKLVDGHSTEIKTLQDRSLVLTTKTKVYMGLILLAGTFIVNVLYQISAYFISRINL